MRKWFVIIILATLIVVASSFIKSGSSRLRDIYSQPANQWPAPLVAPGIQWSELGPLPATPLQYDGDSLKGLIHLGATLFFDPRLSGSGKISCVSCHRPEKSWTDALNKSLGHEGVMNKRNSP